jgi:hypothetical protein
VIGGACLHPPFYIFNFTFPNVPYRKISFMPQSRNRPGHPHHKQAAIPSRQRVKGRVIWAILFAVFALLIAYFAAGENYLVLFLGAVVGAAVGYVVGKNMEKDARE